MFLLYFTLTIHTPDVIVAANVMVVNVDCRDRASAEMMSFFWMGIVCSLLAPGDILLSSSGGHYYLLPNIPFVCQDIYH